MSKLTKSIQQNITGKQKYKSVNSIQNHDPLLYGDIVSNHLLYNEAMSIIDRRLKAIEDKLGLWPVKYTALPLLLDESIDYLHFDHVR